MDRKQNERIASITESTMVIGCDIGSSIHYGRAFNYRGIELSGKPFRFTNDQAGFNSLKSWIDEIKKKDGLDEVVIGFEPTGHYWINLGSFLKSVGIRMVMVNPAHVKRTKEFDDNTQDKNDRKDPKVIAKLVIEGRFTDIYIPEGDYAECRNASILRSEIIKTIVADKNSLHRWLSIHFPEYTSVYTVLTAKSGLLVLKAAPFPDEIVSLGIEGIIRIWKNNKLRGVGMKKASALFEAAKDSIGTVQGREADRLYIRVLLEDLDRKQEQLEQVTGKLEELCEKLPEAKYMLSVPGVGIGTVTGFLGETGELSRFTNPRQIQKLAGLSLVECSSGKHQGQTRISHRGRKRLRHLLFDASLMLVANNPQFKALHLHYTTRKENPLKKKQSIIVISCKLIRVFYTLGTKKIHYDADRLALGIRPPDMSGSSAIS